MTITKQDLDKWIEREAEKIIDNAVNNTHGYFSELDLKGWAAGFKRGAQLSAPLLLQAYQSMKAANNNLVISSHPHCLAAHRMIEQALSQIEAAVKGINRETKD